jgi:type IV secretion system protein VirB6
MGFFATFWSWLDGELAAYIGDNTTRIAAALEPAVVVLATIYVILWGYLQLSGQLQEPVTAGLRRIVVLVVVLGVALHLWLYDSVIVDTFYRAPAALSAAIVGAADPVATVDAIWRSGGQVADELWNRGGVLSGDFGFYLAGVVVWLLMGLLCVYTMFLIALSSIASAILLALGPLFVVMLLFDSTRRYFEGWLAQLATYALINVLTVLVGALLLQLVSSYAAQTAQRGDAILTVDALDMVLAAMIVFLVLRQIMPIASGLAGGVAPSTFGVVSRAVGWGIGRSRLFAREAVGLAADVATAPAAPQRGMRPRAFGEGGA